MIYITQKNLFRLAICSNISSCFSKNVIFPARVFSGLCKYK